MNIQHGLLFTKSTDDEPRPCALTDCNRVILPDAPIVIDVESNEILCIECGKCERYARKKRLQRENAGITEVPLIKGLDY